jgi:hypothetical protein
MRAVMTETNQRTYRCNIFMGRLASRPNLRYDVKSNTSWRGDLKVKVGATGWSH